MNTIQWNIALCIDGLTNLGNEDIVKGPVADLQALMDNWDHFTRDEVDGYLEYQADVLERMSERLTPRECMPCRGAAITLRNAI